MTLPFREIPFSHHKAAVYPWESWSKFLVAGCPSSHQPTRIREETLESGGPLSAGSLFIFIYYYFHVFSDLSFEIEFKYAHCSMLHMHHNPVPAFRLFDGVTRCVNQNYGIHHKWSMSQTYLSEKWLNLATNMVYFLSDQHALNWWNQSTRWKLGCHSWWHLY